MNKIKIFLMMVLASFIFVGCGGSGDEKNTDSDSTNALQEKNEISDEVKKVIYPMPTSFEITKMLNEAGASYIVNLSNPVENVDKYLAEKKQALNLGVYGADLSYASTYNNQEQMMLYLAKSKELAESLQISAVFNEKLVNSINENKDDKDSLVRIITESFHSTYEYLVQNGKENLSLLILVGSWTEGLYISCELALTAKENASQIYKVIASQGEHCKKLINLLEKQKSDANVAEVLELVQRIGKVYEEQGITAETELTVDQMKKIEFVVMDVRNIIIE